MVATEARVAEVTTTAGPTPFGDAWGHAIALLKALRGKPEEAQAKGLVKALEKMRCSGVDKG